MKRMFTLSLAVVVATIVIYWGIATIVGGPGALIHKAFGGAVSALTIVGLLLALGAFGWYLYWLSEHGSKSHSRSGVHALIGVAILVVGAIVGIRWVQWSLGLFWIVPLLAPAIAAAWGVAAIARHIFSDVGGDRIANVTRLFDLGEEEKD